MSIIIKEVGYRENVSPTNPGATLTVRAKGSNNQDAIRVAIHAETPAFLAGFPKLGFNPVWEGGLVWTADVQYGLDRTSITVPTPPQSGATPGVVVPGTEQAPPGPPEAPTDPYDETYTFEAKLGTTHITQSLATVSRTIRNGVVGAAPNFKGAINVDSNGKVAGCDIGAAGGALRWTRTLTVPSIAPDYKDIIRNRIGTVNDRTFYHAKPGEVLFESFSLTKKTLSGWTVSFSFLELENWEEGDERLIIIPEVEEEGEFTDGLVIPAKKGWDYVWLYYQTKKDTDAKKMIERPYAAYVEQVYRYTDFRKLGLTPKPPSGPVPLP